MVGNAPNFGFFFVIFSDSTTTQQKGKTDVLESKETVYCLLTFDRVGMVS